jgi:phosphoribosylanthranilate isomerase
MIGLVHYAPSPRHVGDAVTNSILNAVEPFRKIGKKVALVVVDSISDDLDPRIDYVQVHGNLDTGLPCSIIRAVKDWETFEQLLLAPVQPACDLLYVLEMSTGKLPGGNGAAWDWSQAQPFCKRFPTLLAGGITPENVREAINQAMPYGIDVSSGVESSPGIKDMDKVNRLIHAVCG